MTLTPSPAAAAAAVATTHAFGRSLPFIGTESPTSRARHFQTRRCRRRAAPRTSSRPRRGTPLVLLSAPEDRRV